MDNIDFILSDIYAIQNDLDNMDFNASEIYVIQNNLDNMDFIIHVIQVFLDYMNLIYELYQYHLRHGRRQSFWHVMKMVYLILLQLIIDILQ